MFWSMNVPWSAEAQPADGSIGDLDGEEFVEPDTWSLHRDVQLLRDVDFIPVQDAQPITGVKVEPQDEPELRLIDDDSDGIGPLRHVKKGKGKEKAGTGKGKQKTGKGKGKEKAGKGNEQTVSPADLMQQLQETSVEDPRSQHARCTAHGFRFSNNFPLYLIPHLESDAQSPSIRLLYSSGYLALPLTTPNEHVHACPYPSCKALRPFKDATKRDRHLHNQHVNPSLRAHYKRRVTGCPYCVIYVIQKSKNLVGVPAELLSGPKILEDIKQDDWETILLETNEWPRAVWKKRIFKSGKYHQLHGAAKTNLPAERESEDEGDTPTPEDEE